MIYDLKIEQRALMYIRHMLTQRPYAEVAQMLSALDKQQAEQDEAAAIPISNAGLGGQ